MGAGGERRVVSPLAVPPIETLCSFLAIAYSVGRACLVFNDILSLKAIAVKKIETKLVSIYNRL